MLSEIMQEFVKEATMDKEGMIKPELAKHLVRMLLVLRAESLLLRKPAPQELFQRTVIHRLGQMFHAALVAPRADDDHSFHEAEPFTGDFGGSTRRTHRSERSILRLASAPGGLSSPLDRSNREVD